MVRECLIVLHKIIINYYRGSGDTHQLGHGNQEHVRSPTLIEKLAKFNIIDVSIGNQHCMALTDKGDVYAWGKNSVGEVNASCDIVSEPVLLPEMSAKGAVSVSCGAFEVCINSYCKFSSHG